MTEEMQITLVNIYQGLIHLAAEIPAVEENKNILSTIDHLIDKLDELLYEDEEDES